jgi:hypothetical protein
MSSFFAASGVILIPLSHSRVLMPALAAALLAGCGGGVQDAAQPLTQSIVPTIGSSAPSAAEMSRMYPASQSPASFKAAPMPRTRILPPMPSGNAPGAAAPQSVGTLNWGRITGESSEVAVAPDGTVWALSNDPLGSVNKNIWHRANNAWTNVSGNGSSIAVGPTGTVYTVNGTTHDVYSSTNDGASWTYIGGGARYVTAGADGSIYILSSSNVVSGNSAIWKYANGTWTQQPGSGSLLQESFDPNTYVVAGVGTLVPNGYFLLNSSGATYYYSPGTGYVQFPGTSSGLAAVPGGFFTLTYPASAAGEDLAYFDYASTALTKEPGVGVNLATGPRPSGLGTQLYEVNSADILWTTQIQTTATAPSLPFNDYATFGYDNARDVYNPNSTAITPTTVAGLHLVWQAALDNGSDYGTQTQPVLATEISGHAGVLFVGGDSGNVYAYDALSGALMWTRYLGTMQYSCGGGTSALGVGGTVAYDPASRSLYVIGNSNSATGVYGANTLYHLDGATGTVLGSVNYSGAAAGPSELDLGHTSVTLANGIAYVGTGSTCDIASWRGRVAAVNVPAMTLANTFFTLWDPNNTRGQGAQPWGGGGVWGWGGVSIDPSGNVLTSVGNGDSGGVGEHGTTVAPFALAPFEYSGYAEHVVELTSNLSKVIASNRPIAQSIYSTTGDIDQQGTPIVFTPTGCPTMVAGQGKSGELTLYTEATLANGPVAQYQMGPSGPGGSFLGEPAYSPMTGLVYSDVAASTAPSLFSPGMVAVNPGCGNPSVTWRAAFGSSTAAPRSVPAASAGGVVFAGSGNTLFEINASTGAILNGGAPFLTTNGQLRMPVTIDGNWVFVIDNSADLYAFTTDTRFASIQPKMRRLTARQKALLLPIP